MGKIPIALTAALLVCVGNAVSVRNAHRPFMQTGTRSTFQAVPDLNQTELPSWVENDAPGQDQNELPDWFENDAPDQDQNELPDWFENDAPGQNQTELPDWVENDAESAPEVRAQQYETSDALDAGSFTSEILLGDYPDNWGYWKYF